MVSFFGPLPEPPPVPSIPPQPRWVAPAHDVLPASLAVDLLLAVGPSAALLLSRMAVIGNGLELTLSATLTEPRPGAEDLMHGPGQAGGEDALRFGIAYEDGRRVEAGPRSMERGGGADLSLVHRGGGGTGGHWDQQLWLWPLPERGDIIVVCRWLEHELSEAWASIDAAALADARSRSRPIWT